MTSIKKDIDTEKEKIKEEVHTNAALILQHYQKYFQMMTFFLKLLLLYVNSDKYDKDKIDFDSVTSVVDKRTIMFIHRKIHMYLDEKRKRDVHYAVETLLQMLNVIQAMDGSEEFASVAENLQGNLFYEEDLLKIMAHVIRSCKSEPQRYFFISLLVIWSC
jgi:hypothetical protein